MTLGCHTSHLLRWFADVRGCPPLFVGVVTQLDTRAPPRCELRVGRSLMSARLIARVPAVGDDRLRSRWLQYFAAVQQSRLNTTSGVRETSTPAMHHL